MRSIPTITLLAGDVLIWGLCYACFVGAADGEDPTSREAAKPVVASSSTMPTSATIPSRLTAGEARELVAFHNDARHEVGVGPIEWSPDIAAFAQQWADHIAVTGRFEHRPWEQAKSETDPLETSSRSPVPAPAAGLPLQIYGENLAMGSNPSYSAADGARGWYAEKKDYEPGTAIPSDFTMFKAGHYTQMVWSKTKKIGAGKAIVRAGDFKGWTVIVCDYDPPGNWEGEMPFGQTLNAK